MLRDKTHPIEVFDDYELFRKFRCGRQYILELTDEVSRDIALMNRGGTLTSCLTSPSHFAIFCNIQFSRRVWRIN